MVKGQHVGSRQGWEMSATSCVFCRFPHCCIVPSACLAHPTCRLADWPYIKRCVDAAAGTGIQMIGNGDVFSFEDHYRCVFFRLGCRHNFCPRGALHWAKMLCFAPDFCLLLSGPLAHPAHCTL